MQLRSIEGTNGQAVDARTAETIIGMVRNRTRFAPGDHQAYILRESLYTGDGDAREGVFVVEYEIGGTTRYAVVMEDEVTFDVEDTTVKETAMAYYEDQVREITATSDGPLWETTDVAGLPDPRGRR